MSDEHAPNERTHEAIARKRARRDTAVDERGSNAAATALAQEIRPDLCFDHHEQLRLHDVERAADGESPVERQIEDRVGVRNTSTRDVLP